MIVPPALRRAYRRALLSMAAAVEDGGERLGTWLRARAERRRPRPLRFANPSELMLAELVRSSLEFYPRIMAGLLENRPALLVRVLEDGEPPTPYVPTHP